MGNDLTTVQAVWQLRLQIGAWCRSNPDRTEWWVTKLNNAKERKAQERLRVRRKIIWSAVIAAAQVESCEEEAVVTELQRLQGSCGCGISRVEIWAADAAKQSNAAAAVATPPPLPAATPPPLPAATPPPLPAATQPLLLSILSVARAYCLATATRRSSGPAAW